MKEKVLIVEDQFVEADYLRLMLTNAGYRVTGIAHSVAQAQEMIQLEKPEFVLLDIFLKGKLTGIDLAKQLAQEHIAFVFLSANSNEEILNQAKATQPYGFLVKPFREKDLLITMEIARYRHEHGLESKVRRESSLQKQLSDGIDSDLPWQKKLLSICTALQSHLSFQYVTAGFNQIKDESSRTAMFLRIGYDEYQEIGLPQLKTITGATTKELVALSQNMPWANQPLIRAGNDFEQLCRSPSFPRLLSTFYPTRSLLSFSIGGLFNLCFYSSQPDTYTSDHIGLLNRLEPLLARGLKTILDKNTTTASDTDDTGYDNMTPDSGFEGIIGKSQLLLNVFDLVTKVSTVDTSVLILGESGTGKEKIAECIHRQSPRKNGPLVKVNCAALPEKLIESELFGHEKGAFTGALEKRIGKFEKADKGTIFLDEIGEMPPDLQVKLLRVLQERYIECIGSKEPTNVDVRIIAATNRNLEKEVAEGRFRLDLYYRLNIFPITLPPLRERLEDIPDLARHFMHYYNRKTGRHITGFSDRVLKSMAAYQWPGNIRELENLVERSVLLAKGSVIEDIALPSQSKKESPSTPQGPLKTIAENERDHIVAVLKRCNGRIWGPGGAAEILNIPPTTLTSKMKKLGIQKKYH